MITLINQAYDYLARGGPVMAVIFLASIVALTLIIERFLSLRKEKVFPPKLMDELEHLAEKKKVSEMLALCRASDNSLARVVGGGLRALEESPAEAKEAFEMAGRKELGFLEKNLDYIGILAAVGPLLGLLGTVTGMIQTFGVIRVIGVGDPLKLSGGIAEALLNTAAGLLVGIPALIFHRYFLHRVDGFILRLEEFSQYLLNRVKER